MKHISSCRQQSVEHQQTWKWLVWQGNKEERCILFTAPIMWVVFEPPFWKRGRGAEDIGIVIFFLEYHCCTFNNLSRTELITTPKKVLVCKWIFASNGVYSSLFRAKASGGHSKARETRDAQFMQKFVGFALIGVTPARSRVCKCPPPQIPVSQSPF